MSRFRDPHFLNRPCGALGEKDVEDMETAKPTEDARLPHEGREVFLSRLFLRVVSELLGKGASRTLESVQAALENDIAKNDRKGRARPGGNV